jgi:hypothetical protein
MTEGYYQQVCRAIDRVAVDEPGHAFLKVAVAAAVGGTSASVYEAFARRQPR